MQMFQSLFSWKNDRLVYEESGERKNLVLFVICCSTDRLNWVFWRSSVNVHFFSVCEGKMLLYRRTSVLTTVIRAEWRLLLHWSIASPHHHYHHFHQVKMTSIFVSAFLNSSLIIFFVRLLGLRYHYFRDVNEAFFCDALWFKPTCRKWTSIAHNWPCNGCSIHACGWRKRVW